MTTDTDIIRQLPPRDQRTLWLAEEMADAACGCEAGAFIDRQRKALIAHLSAAPQAVDPTDPGHDVETLREHVRHLERRVQQLAAPQASEPAAPAAPADWSKPTTYLQRFGDAMQLLCGGKRPSDKMMSDWLDTAQGSLDLQEFAIEHGPAWAQGIGLIDAARVLADQPTEGVDHESAPAAPAAGEVAADIVRDAERYRWLRSCGDEWQHLRILDGRGDPVPESLDRECDAAIAASKGAR